MHRCTGMSDLTDQFFGFANPLEGFFRPSGQCPLTGDVELIPDQVNPMRGEMHSSNLFVKRCCLLEWVGRIVGPAGAAVDPADLIKVARPSPAKLPMPSVLCHQLLMDRGGFLLEA